MWRRACVFVLAAMGIGAQCNPGGPPACGTGLALASPDALVCTATCALPTTHASYVACAPGFTCDMATGCYQICGTSACHTGEMCDTSSNTCVRVSGDASVTPMDATADAREASVPSSDAEAGAPEAGPDASMDVVPEAAAPTCALGRPTSGTTRMLTSGNATEFALRVEANANNVIFTDGTRVAVMAPDGVNFRSVTAANVPDVALTATDAYWIAPGTRSQIMRVQIGSFDMSTPIGIASTTSTLQHLATSSEGVYWAESTPTEIVVRRAEFDGQNREVVAQITVNSADNEAPADLAVGGGAVYLALRKGSGSTGCFRVLRMNAGRPPSTPLAPTPVYGPTTGACSSVSYGNLAIDGTTLFFHSSAPTEIVSFPAGGTASRFAGGYGNGVMLGVTAPCLVAATSSLFGITRNVAGVQAGTVLPYDGAPAFLGRIAVADGFAYGFVLNRTAYTLIRYGL